MQYYKTNRGEYIKVGDLWCDALYLFMKKSSIYIDSSNRIRFSEYFHAGKLIHYEVIRKVPK